MQNEEHVEVLSQMLDGVYRAYNGRWCEKKNSRWHCRSLGLSERSWEQLVGKIEDYYKGIKLNINNTNGTDNRS